MSKRQNQKARKGMCKNKMKCSNHPVHVRVKLRRRKTGGRESPSFLSLSLSHPWGSFLLWEKEGVKSNLPFFLSSSRRRWDHHQNGKLALNGLYSNGGKGEEGLLKWLHFVSSLLSSSSLHRPHRKGEGKVGTFLRGSWEGDSARVCFLEVSKNCDVLLQVLFFAFIGQKYGTFVSFCVI